MCIPGLHLSLGIYNRIWSLFTGACTELDLKLVDAINASEPGPSSSSSTHDHFSSSLQKMSLLEMEVDTQRNYAAVLDEMVTYSLLTLPNAQTSTHVRQLRKSAEASHKTLENMV